MTDTNKHDIHEIFDRFCHIKKLLTESTCKCDIMYLNKCDTCSKIICENCDLVKCEICFIKRNYKDWICKDWMCHNCAIYKKKDNGVFWYSCNECKDIDWETIKNEYKQ